MKTTPYLNFDGQCAEAFRFYERVLGGRLEILSHGESPMAAEVPGDWHDRTMHAYLAADGAELMGSDTPPGAFQRPTSIHVALQVDDAGDAERIFHALAEGGAVTMPFQATFWVERFGMLVDRYGVPWIVNGGAPREYDGA